MTRAAFIDAEVPEPTAAWMESVRADLRKASARFGSLLRNEAEANMAVFLADAEVEAAIEARGKHATALKERNVAAVAAVNKSEAELADELADGANRTWSTIPDTNPTKLEPLMSAYKQALEERATTIYVCTTQTLAGRQTVARMTKKRDACRKHLVSIVAERNEAETEMAKPGMGRNSAKIVRSSDMSTVVWALRGSVTPSPTQCRNSDPVEGVAVIVARLSSENSPPPETLPPGDPEDNVSVLEIADVKYTTVSLGGSSDSWLPNR